MGALTTVAIAVWFFAMGYWVVRAFSWGRVAVWGVGLAALIGANVAATLPADLERRDELVQVVVDRWAELACEEGRDPATASFDTREELAGPLGRQGWSMVHLRADGDVVRFRATRIEDAGAVTVHTTERPLPASCR